MFVAGRQLHVDGKVYELGDSVPEAKTWPTYIVESHIKCGTLLDLNKEQFDKVKDDVTKARKQAREQRRLREEEKATDELNQLLKEIRTLTGQLEEKKKRFKEIESKLPKEARDQSHLSPKVEDPNGGEAAVTASPPTTAEKRVGQG